MSKRLSYLLLTVIAGFHNPDPATAQNCHGMRRDTFYVCEGNTHIRLNPAVSSSYLDFRWIPTQGLSDTTILNPEVFIGTTSRSYTLVVRSADPVNKVYNGDFELGYTGFQTPGYTHSCTSGSNPGICCVNTNPTVITGALNQRDRTTGSGKLLFIDPMATPGHPVWRQTVNVTPNTEYLFRGYINNAFEVPPGSIPYAGQPSETQLQINGVPIGNHAYAYLVPDVWEPMTAVWNSGPAAQALLEVINHNPTHGGNDYTIDDISLHRICTDTIHIYIAVAEPPVASLGNDTAVCAASATLQPRIVYSDASYLWNTGDTAASLEVTQSGSYWVQVSRRGCVTSDTIRVQVGLGVTPDLGSDTLLCDVHAPYTLQVPYTAGTTYLWNTGSSDTLLRVTHSGTYWLRTNRNNCPVTDTVHIEIVETPDAFIGNDTAICQQVRLVIGRTATGAGYLWNTGETTPQITVTRSGMYWRLTDRRGCTVQDSIRITVVPNPAADLGPDRDFCAGEQLQIDLGASAHAVRWSTGDTTPVLTIRTGGTYWVRLTTSEGCTGSDTLHVRLLPRPVVRLGADTSVCEETPLLLTPQQLHADSLIWSDGSTGPSLAVTAQGLYTVTGINKCGTGSDTIAVRQIFCDIWVPNVFTPNGDGVNDLFRVLGNIGRLEQFSFSIFNRWGQQLFQTGDRYKGWDGRYKGAETEMGTYVYMLEYSLQGKPVMQKGSFHLLR